MKTTMKTSKEDRTAYYGIRELRTELRKIGRQHLEMRSEDFRFWMNRGTNVEDSEHGSFFDYGLSVDYVAPEALDDEGYLRYQLSYGWSSEEEIRFYFPPQAKEAYKIEFVYFDWGVGVGFDVTNEDWAKWLFDWFNESGTVEAEVQKAFDNE